MAWVARVSSPGSLPEVRSNQSPEGRRSELQVNYPKNCLLAAARQSNRQRVTQDWEESCVALDVRHWWRDRGACRSVTRLASTEKRKGNKMWVPWQPRCPTRLRVCRPDLVNVGTVTVQAVVRAGVGRFLGGVIAA